MPLAALGDVAAEEAVQCEGDACPTAADEAGFIQMMAPNSGTDFDLAEAGEPELRDSPSLVEGKEEHALLYDAIPSQTRTSLDGLARASRKRGGRGKKICKFDNRQDCPIGSLSKRGFSAVMPVLSKWGTHCINASSKYLFQVLPGRTDKLFFYFQDGGACWDTLSASIPYHGTKGACKEEIVLQDEVGVFDTREKLNPFADFTFVHVNYCSGDAHAGNNVMPWGRIAGYNNSRAALAWAMSNMDNHLKDIVIAGASAGSLGAQVWARTMLTTFSKGKRTYDNSLVVADSYLGIFPPKTQPMILDKVFGVCSVPLGRGWHGTCGKDLTVQEAFMQTMSLFPRVPFLVVNSKDDSTQKLFYAAISFTLKHQMVFLNAQQIYSAAAAILQEYSRYPNFGVFQVDGEKHMFLPEERCRRPSGDCAGDMYDATPESPLGALGHSGGTLSEWLAQGLRQRRIESKCAGVTRPFADGRPFPVTACQQDLVGKKVLLS